MAIIQNIGLMITRNEEDVITEVMTEISKYFEIVLVMDNSTDKTREIIEAYPCVKYIVNQKDIYGDMFITDGMRQHLLEKAQEMYGYEGWFTLLQGDEIFHSNPNTIIADADIKGCEIVVWHSLQFFMHTSERDGNEKLELPVQQRRKWYSPGCYEERQFINKKGLYYPLDQQRKCSPSGLNISKCYPYRPILKHYHIRSEQQVLNRAKDRLATGFQLMYQWVIDNGAYCDVHPGLSEARHVDNYPVENYSIACQITDNILRKVDKLVQEKRNSEQ